MMVPNPGLLTLLLLLVRFYLSIRNDQLTYNVSNVRTGLLASSNIDCCIHCYQFTNIFFKCIDKLLICIDTIDVSDKRFTVSKKLRSINTTSAVSLQAVFVVTALLQHQKLHSQIFDFQCCHSVIRDYTRCKLCSNRGRVGFTESYSAHLKIFFRRAWTCGVGDASTAWFWIMQIQNVIHPVKIVRLLITHYLPWFIRDSLGSINAITLSSCSKLLTSSMAVKYCLLLYEIYLS
jgi:hypothetical protein